MYKIKTYSEKLITKINYSPQVKGLFAAAMFGAPAIALGVLDRGPFGQSLPPFMRGRLFDIMSTPVYASMAKVGSDENFALDFGFGIGFPFLEEILQGLEKIPGTFDWGDFGAYTIGALGWVGFEGLAKAIHDSGISLPIYRALGIQHR